MNIPDFKVPIIKIPYSEKVELYIKREDLIHPEISGNKYWKLFYNIKSYLALKKNNPRLITFGGAFSNHISAVAALGRQLAVPTIGIIRGEEIINKWNDNPTLSKAYADGMRFEFVSRTAYRDKNTLSQHFQEKFPEALLIPEGGSNELAIKGIQHMLDEETKEFDYLCAAVGTGGTIAGITQYAEENQRIIGFKVVQDDETDESVKNWSSTSKTVLLNASEGGYGKISDELIAFINAFYKKFGIPLDPVYTGKMMKLLTRMMDENYFPIGCKILAFHTGGLQGTDGMNEYLKKHNKVTLKTIQ